MIVIIIIIIVIIIFIIVILIIVVIIIIIIMIVIIIILAMSAMETKERPLDRRSVAPDKEIGGCLRSIDCWDDDDDDDDDDGDGDVDVVCNTLKQRYSCRWERSPSRCLRVWSLQSRPSPSSPPPPESKRQSLIQSINICQHQPDTIDWGQNSKSS